jgi:hypothetical protein
MRIIFPNEDNQPNKKPKKILNKFTLPHNQIFEIQKNFQSTNLSDKPPKLISSHNGEPYRNPSRRSGDLVAVVRFINRALLNHLLQQWQHLRHQFHHQSLVFGHRTTIHAQLTNHLRVFLSVSDAISFGELAKGRVR